MILTLNVSLIYLNLQSSWANVVRSVWNVNPTAAIQLAERFKNVTVRNEVTKLVRSNTLQVIDTPEALPFLLGDRIDLHDSRDLKVPTSEWHHVVFLLFCSLCCYGLLFHLSWPRPYLNDGSRTIQ